MQDFKKQLITALLCILPISLHAAELAGVWQTTDDKTGKPRSLVRIVENGGEYSATIEKGLLKKACCRQTPGMPYVTSVPMRVKARKLSA